MIGQVHFDLLHVIAYGPTVAKVAAANLLFLYWPSLNPTPAERKVRTLLETVLSADC